MEEAVLKQKISRLIFPVALLFPMVLMTANPVYDELWSLIFFSELPVTQILTDLALPNNHPLNTFFLKILSLISFNTVFLRLPSLICGAFIPVLCGELAYRWSKKNHLASMIAAALLAMLSVPLAVLSGLARGYAMQLFFLILCIWAMSTLRENPKRSAVLTAVSGIGTFLCVPTGALFLLPAGIGFLIYSGRKERTDHRMWIAALVIAVAGGIFYGVNFSALRTAQVWGMEINSAADYRQFLWLIFSSLLFVPALAATVPAWINEPKRLYAAGLLLLPLLLALFSNGGPARTYLYLPVAVAIAGGIGIGEVSGRWQGREVPVSAVIALVLAIPGIFLQLDLWRVPDYTAIFEKHRQSCPPEILPVYRASVGFPIRNALPEALEAYNLQVLSGNFSKVAFFETEPGEFNGLDARQSEAVLSGSCRGQETEFDGLTCVIYDLTRVDRMTENGSYLLIFNGSDQNSPEMLDNAGEMLYLNIWFTEKVKLAVFRCETAVELPFRVKIYRIGD